MKLKPKLPNAVREFGREAAPGAFLWAGAGGTLSSLVLGFISNTEYELSGDRPYIPQIIAVGLGGVACVANGLRLASKLGPCPVLEAEKAWEAEQDAQRLARMALAATEEPALTPDRGTQWLPGPEVHELAGIAQVIGGDKATLSPNILQPTQVTVE